MPTIAVPIRDGKFCDHFGGAEAFSLYTVDDADSVVVERRVLQPPEHGRGVYPVWLRKVGAQVILAGGMGPRAIGILTHHGIEVVLGVQGTDPDLMVQDYLAGTLDATGDACHDHGHHDCGHPEVTGNRACGDLHADD
jgi:predicted Fe-Mo cluster-binding NifX family protein